MYLNIGQDLAVHGKEVLGIFDLDNVGRQKRTIEYLRAAEKAGEVTVLSGDIPKSLVLCERDGKQRVILAQVSPATLKIRATERNSP